MTRLPVDGQEDLLLPDEHRSMAAHHRQMAELNSPVGSHLRAAHEAAADAHARAAESGRSADSKAASTMTELANITANELIQAGAMR